jgi:hypothetical protein
MGGSHKWQTLRSCRGFCIGGKMVVLVNILLRHSPVMPRARQLSFKLQGRVIHRLIDASETARN